MLVGENGMCTLNEEDYSYHSNGREKRKTNADRIRAMTDEELAEWLERIRLYCGNDLCGRGCPLEEVCYSKEDAPIETLDWLKEEASE